MFEAKKWRGSSGGLGERSGVTCDSCLRVQLCPGTETSDSNKLVIYLHVYNTHKIKPCTGTVSLGHDHPKPIPKPKHTCDHSGLHVVKMTIHNGLKGCRFAQSEKLTVGLNSPNFVLKVAFHSFPEQAHSCFFSLPFQNSLHPINDWVLLG